MIMLAWPILVLAVPALALDIAVDHKPRCVIAVPDDASSHEQVAAEELQLFVWASTRAKLEIVAEGGVKGAAIFVGLTERAKALGLPDAKLGRAGYVQKLTDDALILAGNEGLAHRYAVYDFLHRIVGCRWYIPTELFQHVPTRATLIISQLNRRDVPAFDPRTYGYIWNGRQCSYVGKEDPVTGNDIWATRNRMTTDRRGMPQEHSHNLRNIIVPSKHYDEHPEYFPLRGGKRYRPAHDSANNWQPCTSNPGVVRVYVEAARRFFNRDKAGLAFSLGITDGAGWCECQQCRALDRGETFRGRPVMSDRYYTFVNQVAREVAKTHPDRMLGCIAYIHVELPPQFDLEPNVMVFNTQDTAQHHDPAYRKADRDMLTRWGRRCRYLGKYDYYGALGWVLPRYFPRLIAEDLRFARTVGMKALYAEDVPTWGTMGPLTWIGARLLWDPDQDPHELQGEFCRDMFGPAADTMDRYFSLLQEIWDRPRQGRWFAGLNNISHQLTLYTPSDARRLGGLLVQARKEADTELTRRRADFFARAWRVCELYARERDALAGLVSASEGADDALDQARLIIVRLQDQMARRKEYNKKIQADDLLGGTLDWMLNENAGRVGWETHVAQVQRQACTHLVGRLGAARPDAASARAHLKTALEGTPLAIFGAGLQALNSPGAGDRNMIKNPGFEQTSDRGEPKNIAADWSLNGAPPEWSTWHFKGAPATAKFVWQKGQAHSGHFCVRLESIPHDCCFNHKVPVEPGKAYALCAFARTTRLDHPDDTWIQVRWQDGKHAWVGQDEEVAVHLPEAKPGWQPLVTVFRVPQKARYVVLLLTAKNQAEGEASWYDDVLLVPATE